MRLVCIAVISLQLPFLTSLSPSLIMTFFLTFILCLFNLHTLSSMPFSRIYRLIHLQSPLPHSFPVHPDTTLPLRQSFRICTTSCMAHPHYTYPFIISYFTTVSPFSHIHPPVLSPSFRSPSFLQFRTSFFLPNFQNFLFFLYIFFTTFFKIFPRTFFSQNFFFQKLFP